MLHGTEICALSPPPVTVVIPSARLKMQCNYKRIYFNALQILSGGNKVILHLSVNKD